jgi:hypothetical protein
METTGIEISTHPFKYIKRTRIHPSIDWHDEIGPLHPSKWGALTPSYFIFAKWIWHVMKSIWNMMEMSYKYLGTSLEQGNHFNNLSFYSLEEYKHNIIFKKIMTYHPCDMTNCYKHQWNTFFYAF